MAMSDDQESGGGAEELLDGLDPEALDGHTVEELSDYLDAGRSPRSAGIENSPGCLIALDALTRLRSATWEMLEAEAAEDTGRDEVWIKNVMENISREARAGRDIPISSVDPTVRLAVTEGSVRGLIRAAGDGVGGAIMGRVRLDGDVSVEGEPIAIDVTASGVFGRNLLELAQEMRVVIGAAIRQHTELNVASIDVTIQDVHSRRTATTEDPR
jgi:uncharacterized alkaline shock family protein YloU